MASEHSLDSAKEIVLGTLAQLGFLLFRAFGKYEKQDCSYQGKALIVPTVHELVSNCFWYMKFLQTTNFRLIQVSKFESFMQILRPISLPQFHAERLWEGILTTVKNGSSVDLYVQAFISQHRIDFLTPLF